MINKNDEEEKVYKCVTCGKRLDLIDLLEILFRGAEHYNKCVSCQSGNYENLNKYFVMYPARVK